MLLYNNNIVLLYPGRCIAYKSLYLGGSNQKGAFSRLHVHVYEGVGISLV